ncbi:hypothetical protein AXF42_Ash001064 [Apostasia shenzhenica]|uniref:Late embryogenesis abundant protein LEA-2 subgroup domain-containing protein n=1 Tax=Apostasia shenzhenica TaxID=1088818 RepID=A0A2I0ATU8_9ASPA|nr:hypothetical protein AXF42_Ash001064 [Apostasia shenzhenica]
MAEEAKPVLQKPPGYRDPSESSPAPVRPPKKAQLPPALRHPGVPSRRQPTGRSCCCCFFILILVLLIVFSVSGGAAYLWFKPRLPSFRVVNATSPMFKVTARSDGTILDASVRVKIEASNPNEKLGLAFRGSEARIGAADEDGMVEVGKGSAAAFSVRPRSSTAMIFAAAAKGLMIGDAVGTRLKARYKSKDIGIVVELSTKVGFVVGGKFTPKILIRVKCGAARLNQIGNRRSPGSLPKCDLRFFDG